MNETIQVEQPLDAATVSILDMPEIPEGSPLDVPVEDVQRPQTKDSVVNVDLMAASLSAATDGKLPLREAYIASMVENSGKTVRDLAASIYVDSIQNARGSFANAAAQGNLADAEMYARQLDSLQAALTKNDHAKNVSTVVETAGLNTATKNPDTRNNNTIEALVEVVNKESSNVANFEIVTRAIVDVYGDKVPGIKDMVMLFGGTIGVPIIASLATKGVAGGITGAAVGAAYTYETVYKPSKIIEQITGIPAQGLLGMDYAKQREMLDAYAATLSPRERVDLYTEMAKRILTDLNPALPKGVAQLFALMNVAKLYDSVNETVWKDGDILPTLSLRMASVVDALSNVLDIAGVIESGKKIYKVINAESKLAGGATSGARVGEDVKNGLETPGMSSADQTAFVTTGDLSKILDLSAGGTEGTEAAAAQLKISEKLKEVVASINNQIRVGANEEAQAMRKVLDYTVTGGMDGSIAHYNAQTNTLVLQHPSGKPFATESVAKQIAEWATKQANHPDVRFEVIPADGNAVVKLSSKTAILLDESETLAKMVDKSVATNTPLKAEKVLDAVMKDANFISTVEATPSVQAAAREVAKFLKENGVLKNLDVEIIKDENDWERVVRRVLAGSDEATIKKRIKGVGGLLGLMDPQTNRVYVRASHASSPSLMLHEIAHGRFGGILDVALKGNAKMQKAAKLTEGQKAAAKNLYDLWDYVTGEVSQHYSAEEWAHKIRTQHDHYGFSNVHEMVSEILSPSSENFRMFLKDMPLPMELKAVLHEEEYFRTGKVTTVFQAIVKTLAKLFNIATDNDNAFIHIMDQIAKLSKDIDPAQQNIIAQLKKSGLSNKEILKVFYEPFEKRLSHGFFVRHVGTANRHTQAEIDSVALIGADPAHTASRLSVAERFIAQQGSVKDRETIAKYVKDGVKGLSKKDMRVLEKVLEEGDTLEREFTVVDLNARGFSDKMKNAYYTIRTTSHLMYVMKNNLAKTEMLNLGFARQAFLNLGGGATDTSPAKFVNVADFHGKRAYDLDTGKTVLLDSANPPVGQTLAHTYNNITVGGNEYSLFLGTGRNITWGSLLDPIPFRAGTFRRIYTDDVFATVKRKVNVNGIEEIKETALRTGRSIKDATKWAKGMNEILHMHKNNPAGVTIPFIESKVGRWENAADIHADINSGRWDGYETFESKYTRSSSDLVQSLAKGLHDGKSQGVRGEQRLKAIDDINRPNTLPPLQALEAEVGNVSFMKNTNEWRQKWVDTWFNTFEHLIPDSVRTSGRSPLQILSDPNWQLSSYRGSDPAVKFAEAQRNYILDQLGVETMSERMIKHSIEGITSAFTEDTKLIGMSIGKPFVTAGWMLRQADPLQFIRSFNFYSMLSGFNVSQLMVQAAGAGTAIAIHPIYGAQAAYMAPMLRIALASDNPAVWATVAKLDKVMKLGLGSTQDFMDSVRAIQKLGLLKGIAATSMHNLEAGAFNMFGGTMDTIKNVAAAPFNRGEEFARLVSFDVARREWMSKNPGQIWTTDSALQAIMTRTDDYTMNMTNANKAWFQKGVYSIPGQFLQYNIKLAANLFDGLLEGKKARTFDRADAMKVMAFHTVMYGAVGNGISYMADEITGGWEWVVGREVTDDEKLAISQGMLSAVINETWQALSGDDLKLALGSRLGVGEFYENFIRGVTRGDQSLWQTVLGPTHASIRRAYGAAGDLLIPFQRKDYSAAATLEAINDVGKALMSSWRNATKAYVAMQNGNKIMDEYGIPLARLSGPEVFFQALGIGSAVEADYYRNRRNHSEMTRTIKELADTWVQARIQYNQALIDGDQSRADKINAFMAAIAPTNAGHRKIFDDQVKARSSWPHPWGDKLNKQIDDWVHKTQTPDTMYTRAGSPVESK